MNFDQFDEIALVSGDDAFADPVARRSEGTHGLLHKSTYPGGSN